MTIKPLKIFSAASLILLILVLSGCGGIKSHYPVWPVPERPRVTITDTGDHCLTNSGLISLNEYVIKLEAVLLKYEKEIRIINTGDAE